MQTCLMRNLLNSSTQIKLIVLIQSQLPLIWWIQKPNQELLKNSEETKKIQVEENRYEKTIRELNELKVDIKSGTSSLVDTKSNHD